jgi:hypothetical protein
MERFAMPAVRVKSEEEAERLGIKLSPSRGGKPKTKRRQREKPDDEIRRLSQARAKVLKEAKAKENLAKARADLRKAKERLSKANEQLGVGFSVGRIIRRTNQVIDSIGKGMEKIGGGSQKRKPKRKRTGYRKPVKKKGR